MLVNDKTRRALVARRQQRELEAKGYRRHETDWEIHRGWMSYQKFVILDAIVSSDGGWVYTKVGPRTSAL